MTPREFQSVVASKDRRKREAWVQQAWFVLPLLNIQLRRGEEFEMNDLLPPSMQLSEEVPTESKLLADREHLKQVLAQRTKEGASE